MLSASSSFCRLYCLLLEILFVFPHWGGRIHFPPWYLPWWKLEWILTPYNYVILLFGFVMWESLLGSSPARPQSYHPSTQSPIHPSTHLSVHLPYHPFIYQFIHSHVHPSTYPMTVMEHLWYVRHGSKSWGHNVNKNMFAALWVWVLFWIFISFPSESPSHAWHELSLYMFISPTRFSWR